MDSIDLFLISATRACVSPLSIFFQIQITCLYVGAVEFLFVLESAEDPTYPAVSRLLQEFQVFVDNFLFTISAFRSQFSLSINWSGNRYYLKNGKIYKIDRGKEIGPEYTELGGKNLCGKRGSPPQSSLISSVTGMIDQWWKPKKYDL